MMATRIEYEEWKNKYKTNDVAKPTTTKKYTTKKNLSETMSKKTQTTLDNFFDESKSNNPIEDINFDSLFVDNKEK